MVMAPELRVMGSEGLQRFQALQAHAVDVVTDRFYVAHGATYARFGPRGREARREDLAFHLDSVRFWSLERCSLWSIIWSG